MSAWQPRPHWQPQRLWDAVRAVMGRPYSPPQEDYAQPVTAELDISQAVTLNSGGAGTVTFMPDGMTVWDIRQVQLATTTGPIDGSEAKGYTSGVYPHRQVFQTNQAGGDSFDFAKRLRPGDMLIIVWSGGTAGDVATCCLTGHQHALAAG